MEKEQKTELDILEDSLLSFWKRNNQRRIVRGFHTEIELEPKVFIQGELNPEIAAILAEQILVQLLSNKEQAKRVKISRAAIVINDEKGSPIMEIKDQRIINALLSR